MTALYLKLIKFRLSLAVAFSAAAGYVIFEDAGSVKGLSAVFSGVFFLAGGAAALNQYQERRTDALMARTKGRPLPSHQLRSAAALITALGMIAEGTALLATFTGLLPALLGIFNVALYNFVYTPLKRHTFLAIIPGGLVGAVPPLIGFTAAGGVLSDPRALFVALFMFMWQLPHFWLLMLAYRRDYEKAGLGSLVKKPTEHDARVIVPAWLVVTSVLLLFAPRFGMEMGMGLWFAMVAVNTAVCAAFLVILPGKPEGISGKSGFMTLNSFGMAVLVIFMLSAII